MCVLVCADVCVRDVFLCMCDSMFMCSGMYNFAYMCVYVCICMFVCVFICMCICVCIYVHGCLVAWFSWSTKYGFVTSISPSVLASPGHS